MGKPTIQLASEKVPIYINDHRGFWEKTPASGNDRINFGKTAQTDGNRRRHIFFM